MRVAARNPNRVNSMVLPCTGAELAPAIAGCCVDIVRFDLRQQLSSIDAPTLAITGALIDHLEQR